MKKNRLSFAITLILACNLAICQDNKKTVTFQCEDLTTTMNFSRFFLNDSLFVEEFFYTDTSQNHFSASNKDTFMIKKEELYYKRNQFYFQYFSEKSFEHGDTIKMYSKAPIEKSGRKFWLEAFYIPLKKMQYNGEEVLVYKWMGHFDSPQYSLSKIYFSQKKRQIVFMYSESLGNCEIK
jgi:hypothetical protein